MAREHLLENRIPPPVVAVGLLVLGWLLAKVLAWGTFDFAGRELLGIGFCMAGLAIIATAIAGFHRRRTTVDPLHPAKASALVTGCIFGITRNPMYLGMALVLAGLAAYAGQGAMAIAPVGFVAFITRYQIMPEERALAAAFGAEFAAYRARVRRWL